MSETPSQDPSIAAGNTVEARFIDMHDPSLVETLKAQGELFLRKVEPIKGFRDPEEEEEVQTIVNGIVESINVARPGENKIITGSRGEEFVFSTAKFESMYYQDEDGNTVPYKRYVLAMKNPFDQPISADAPWSTPDNPQTINGTTEAMLTFGLDAAGELTDDRYFIGDRDMLLANYDPASE